jgi:hypothetical protein
MITSSLIRQPVFCVCHTVTGIPTLDELTLAIQHTLQHTEIPVLWDLQALDIDALAPDLDATMSRYERDLRALIQRSRREMSAKKRAFVVKAVARPQFEAFLQRLRLPWSWAVFESADAAIAWLQD